MKKLLLTAIVLSMGLMIGTPLAYATTLDLTDPTDSGTIDSALFARTELSGQGTGNFEAFLRVHATSTPTNPENGYNTGLIAGRTVEFDTMDDPHTHEILLSSIPIFNINGTDYYEFAFDAAEPGDGGGPNTINVEVLEIYLMSSPYIQSYATLVSSGQLKYDLDASADSNVLLLDEVTGSGIADLFVYVPVTNFADINPNNQWVYLYAEMSMTSGSFEEWGRRILTEECTENCDPVVPEPTSMLLFGTGLVGAILRKKYS